MSMRVSIAALAGAALIAGSAAAQTPPVITKVPYLAPAHAAKLHVHVDGIKYGHPLPATYAFCAPAA